MRIISGTVGGRTIVAPPGRSTRPTSDRVREAVFNILMARGAVPDEVLDLYAGSGAMGLEALSRGARRATFVEHHGPTAAIIVRNARSLGLEERVTIVGVSVVEWLAARSASLSTAGSFSGWIFVDPPYESPELARCLEVLGELAEAGSLAPGALVVAEHATKQKPGQALPERAGGLERVDRRSYGQTSVSFYAKVPSGDQ